MSAADEAREVEVVARAMFDDDCADLPETWDQWRAERSAYLSMARAALAALEPIRAAERQEAARGAVAALELQQEWSHRCGGFSRRRWATPWVDDVDEPDDRADGVAGRMET